MKTFGVHQYLRPTKERINFLQYPNLKFFYIKRRWLKILSELKLRNVFLSL
jgi:hypothetical protein